MSGIIHLSDQRRYFLYRLETDMRKGFDSLCGIVKNELDKPLTSGDAFIFINRLRTHLKLLVWESGGFTICYRRLEQGTFEVPAFPLDSKSMCISSHQLYMMLQGISMRTIKYRKRYQQQSASG